MKNRFFTLLALLLSVGIAAPACGGDDDDNPAGDDDDDDDDGTGGGGTGGGGTGGGGTGGGGTGGGGTGGGGTGGGGTGGSGGGNQNGDFEETYELTGGDDIDAEDEIRLFPFAVAADRNNRVFVSTLGNNQDVNSRIYRLDGTNPPEMFFETGNIDAAVYGIVISDDDKLYACISPHLGDLGANVAATIYQFDNLNANDQKGQGFTPISLSTIVQVNAAEVVQVGQKTIERCGAIAYDGESLYVPDVSGVEQSIFRVKLDADADTAPDIDDNGNVNNFGELQVTAWFNDVVNLGAGQLFGVSGITFANNQVRFVRDDDGGTLFKVDVAGGGKPEAEVAEESTIVNNINTPSGIAVGASGTVYISSLDDNEVFRLQDNGNNDFNTISVVNDQSSADDNRFVQPINPFIKGNQGLVVGSRLDEFAVSGDEAVNTFKIFRFNAN